MLYYNNILYITYLASTNKIKSVKKFYGEGNILFENFKYNNILYSVGDDVQIHDESTEPLVGKITKILTFYGNSKYPHWPTIEVQWYYRRSDLIKDPKFTNKIKIECINRRRLII